ncbi:MAG: barstar family protein [Nitrospiraceae bacterium]|nr:barstar family protein [Nitrospiraceae bacterium]
MPTTVLQSTKQPWAHLLVHGEQDKPETLLSLPSGFLLKTVSGAKCKTKAGLLSEFARILSFPDYFGHNWDALEECLIDLEWLPAKGYVVVVTDADQLLAKPDEEDDYQTFIEILTEAGEGWSSHRDEANGAGLPFHTVLAVSERHKSKRRNWLVPPLLLEVSAKKQQAGRAAGPRKR